MTRLVDDWRSLASVRRQQSTKRTLYPTPHHIEETR